VLVTRFSFASLSVHDVDVVSGDSVRGPELRLFWHFSMMLDAEVVQLLCSFYM
jgi:hypothetical protein